MVFDTVSKEKWLDRIKKDLKNTPLKDCYTALDDNLVLDPFSAIEDFDVEGIGPLKKNVNSWIPTVGFNPGETDLNSKVLETLSHGAEGIRLNLTKNDQLYSIYKEVFPQYIYNDFKQINRDQLIELQLLANKSNESLLRGYLCLTDKGQIEEVLKTSVFDLFHLFDIQEKGVGLINDLEDIFKETINLISAGMNPNRIRISLGADSKTLKNIIKIRAVKMLWNNLLDHFKLEQVPVFINSELNEQLSEISDGTQLISAANIASSLVIGGVDQFSLFDFNEDGEKARLGLNIHHLLKTEAKMDGLIDPLSGCYAVEKASIELSKEVWKKL